MNLVKKYFQTEEEEGMRLYLVIDHKDRSKC